MQISGEDLEREERWAAEKKYYAARSVWNRRNQLEPGKGFTWGQWFQRMFGENLMEFVASKAKEKSDSL